MSTGVYASAALLSLFIASIPSCEAAPWPASPLARRISNPLNIDWSPAPSPEDGPPASAHALRNPAYLPAEIGGIVGSYALSLVLVAIGLLALSKRRREHLRAGEEPILASPAHAPIFQITERFNEPPDPKKFLYPLQTPKNSHINPSFPALSSPTGTERTEGSTYFYPSPTSTIIAPGVNLTVDQQVVAQDRIMAQQQLEDMYKHVMEHEAARIEGRDYKVTQSSTNPSRKERVKPASLSLEQDAKKQSRTSSLISSLKSPLRKNVKGVSISSPIMTPMSGTFPRQDYEEMSAMAPRQYAPVQAPPPVPSTDHLPLRRNTGSTTPITPDASPDSVQTIDGRLDAAIAQGRQPWESRGPSRSRESSIASSSIAEPLEPASAISVSSTAPLVGLPSSPRPGVSRFPSQVSLPASPRPGQTFSRPNAPSALRTGGALPLRAYEPSLISPREQNTKQTVFTRATPMSPGMRTPFTGAPVPYTPYQPFSPVVPITPSLVTKADRRRMRKLEPKTPTLEMVKSDDEVW